MISNMTDIRQEVTEKLKLYVGPGPEQVRSGIAAHILRYSRVQFDRFLHPEKPFWPPEKRCDDFIKLFEEIDKLEDASLKFILSWNNQGMSNAEICIFNCVYDITIKRILNSKKLSLKNKVWLLVNEVLRRRIELGG